jgi:hypothetical protein
MIHIYTYTSSQVGLCHMTYDIIIDTIIHHILIMHTYLIRRIYILCHITYNIYTYTSVTGLYVTCITIIDTIIHHILIIHTNDAYTYDTHTHIHLSDRLLRDSNSMYHMYHNNRHNYTDYTH